MHRPSWLETTPRPATRAHTRNHSYSHNPNMSPRPPKDSPRYNSSGQYSTQDDGTFFHDPLAQQREPVYEPSPAAARRAYPPSALHTRAPTSMGQRPRRSSASVPQRPSTVRPMAAMPARHPRPAKSSKTGPREVTEADLLRHRIPQGYSTKNWDPDEDPILLLGSVFDANTLGKWIYDWTVYEHKAGSPLSDMAGSLWLQMISVFSKIRSAEEVVGSVRRPDRREMLEDFIDTGEDIVARLRFILKACEAPMLRTAKKNGSGLGESAGSSFVHSLFGRERQLPRLENLMHRMDLFDQRWEQNCADIVSRPTL